MKKKHNEGFTLVELLVSMVILAAIVVPTCTSLVLSYRVNAKADEMMQAQLAVSSAVETLMAEGITAEFVASVRESAVEAGTIQTVDGVEIIMGTSNAFPGLLFVLADRGEYYEVRVQDEDGLAPVSTSIRDCTTPKGGSGS